MNAKKIPAWFPKVGALVQVSFQSKSRASIVATVTEVLHCGFHIRARLDKGGVMSLPPKPVLNPKDETQWMMNGYFILNFSPEWNLHDGDLAETIIPVPIKELTVFRPKLVWPRKGRQVA